MPQQTAGSSGPESLALVSDALSARYHPDREISMRSAARGCHVVVATTAILPNARRLRSAESVDHYSFKLTTGSWSVHSTPLANCLMLAKYDYLYSAFPRIVFVSIFSDQTITSM